mmetsp:Transcript_34261/g.60240  ORF Transcript_34261/g.60240 Transcript_34261/m.60240 type:complete len:111 (-) Transcript_34261:585-917(-)
MVRVTLGCADWDGTNEGYSDGGIDGMADILGFIDGCNEVEGCMEGIEEGASLCGKAPEITKSDAVADAALEIASTSAIEIMLAGIPPSKFKTAMPLTSYIPGAMIESSMI